MSRVVVSGISMIDKRLLPRRVLESGGNRWDWALLPLVLALLVAAAAEPFLLASATTLRDFAVRVLILQAVTAVVIVAVGFVAGRYRSASA